jgi:hypothetical protein
LLQVLDIVGEGGGVGGSLTIEAGGSSTQSLDKALVGLSGGGELEFTLGRAIVRSRWFQVRGSSTLDIKHNIRILD